MIHPFNLKPKPKPKFHALFWFFQESRTDDELDDVVLDPSKVEIISVASKAAEQAEEFVRHVWQAGWKVVNHHELPKWLRDNDFLIAGHRPQLNSYTSCFKSVFRIHTETGNIWTHLLGTPPAKLGFSAINFQYMIQ